MVKKQVLFIGLIALISLVNSGSDDSNVEGPSKQKVNFYGKLETWSGKGYKIDNIAIGRKFKQIDFYELPAKTKDMGHEVKTNPKDGIVTRIDLAEICEIKVPEPDVTWTYEKKDRSSDYTQVDIVSHDGSVDSYLIESGRKMTCDKKKKGAPTEIIVPFASIKRLLIKGYTLRESKTERELEDERSRCKCSSADDDMDEPKPSSPVALPEKK